MRGRPRCLLALVLLASAALAQPSAKPIRVSLTANWPETPLPLEAAEFVAAEGAELFWRYAEALRGDAYAEAAASVLPPARASILSLYASSRYYSPVVELHRQLDLADREELSVDAKLRSWALVGGDVVSSPADVRAAVDSAARRSALGTVLDTDHVHPACADPAVPLVVLYSQLGTPEFLSWHSELAKMAGEGRARYALRHSYVAGEELVRLQGYGVSLALKSVEYKAIDEPAGAGGEEKKSTADLASLEAKAAHGDAKVGDLEFSDDFDKLEQKELREIGFQAATVVMGAEDKLLMMQRVAQDFPSLAVSLTKVSINMTLVRALVENSNHMGYGYTVASVNGRDIDCAKSDLFQVLDVVREETRKADALVSLGLAPESASSLMSSSAGEQSEPVRVALDSGAVVWVNDLEHEPHYRRFWRSVGDFLRPVYPGQLRYVARNLFNVLLVVDPADRRSLDLCATFSYFVEQSLPMRVGVLVTARSAGAPQECDDSGNCRAADSLAASVARAFKSLAANGGPRAGMAFLGAMGTSLAESHEDELTLDVARSSYEQVRRMYGVRQSFSDAAGGEDTARWLEESNAFAAGAGVDDAPLVFVNGVLYGDISNPSATVMKAANEQTHRITTLIRTGAITDDTPDIYKLLLEGAAPKYSKIASVSDARPLKYVSLVTPAAGRAFETAKFFSAGKGPEAKRFTHFVCADLATDAGRRVASAALELAAESNDSRVALLSASSPPSASAAWAAATAAPSAAEASKVLAAAAQQQQQQNAAAEKVSEVEAAQRQFCASVFGAGAGGVVTNGRVVALQPADVVERFDLAVVENMEAARAAPVEHAIGEQVAGAARSDLVAKAASLIGLDAAQGITRRRPLPEAVQRSFEIRKPGAQCLASIQALVNPLSKAAQRIVPILRAIAESGAACVSVVLNPAHEVEGLPLKTFYRGVVASATGEALFEGMPERRLLTVGLDVPHPWVVMAAVARHDLDNVRLGDAQVGPEGVVAVYRLENLLVEGNCYEQPKGAPPRGLEVILAPRAGAQRASDTLVMSNFGYFQLKANPGMWVLSIREGRSRELYEAVRDSSDAGLPVVVSSFLSNTVQLDVRKRHGKESVPLLPSDAELEKERERGAAGSEGLWGKISSMIGGDKGQQRRGAGANVSDDDKVHVFSVASGHLYERFLKIMMLSVAKHSSVPVKFWLIKNYLSPRLINSLPQFARAKGFEYEFVTYKFPQWLNPQTEKQRIIWAYKILFLDVLFPISLKRVIFVDADQAVRGDLKELMDYDLGKAAIGMTPFCRGENQNPETTGFRFWDQGYWKEHLRGRPYHISALFVVDLARFRRLAAGDQYRIHYDSLSRDPNSLANLDQDLPNYLQHVVKLHSLPPEWLWCETWCTQELKKRAKTIDLCNNPLTKAPKLDNAVRIIEEWRDLDNEARAADESAGNSS
eukprot:m51a1_g7285 putative UDP-glucose:glycoprotein glucosyltransferase (1435) ;mRNA; r:34055-38973